MPTIALIIAFFLVAGAPGRAQQGETRLLTTCAEVRDLPREQAAQGIPVRLRGVVTFINSPENFAIADSTGLWVRNWQNVTTVQPGDLVEITGRTNEGNFAPIVIATGVRYLGPGSLPPPKELTGPAMRSGELDVQRARVTGVVRGRVPPEPDALHSVALILSTVYGQIPIQIYGADVGIGVEWDDAEVEATGIVLAFFNARGQTQGARLATNSAADIRIIRAAPGKPFDAPVVALGDVLRFSPGGPTLHRQRVIGTVTYCQPGKYFFLQEGPHALRVDTRQAGRLEPGDRVEAAGFLDVVDSKPQLGESVFRRVGRMVPPEAVEITVEQALRPNRFPEAGEYPDFDDRLVFLCGRLLTLERSGEGMRLNLERDGVLIPVEIAGGAGSTELDSLEPGSELRVRGVCTLAYSESFRVLAWPRPVSLRVLARDAADIEVIRKAPWWTARRLWTALTVTGGVLLSSLLWIVLLRRRVAHRSQQLAAEMQARHGAAVEFESTLRERTRLAADLHDTLEQSLTGLALQLEAGEALIDSSLDRSRHHFGLGQQLLSRSREDLRRSIWNLRSIALDEGSLVEALERVAGHRARGAGVEIAVECEGMQRPVPDLIAGNLLLLAQEAITNALKHASARRIVLTLLFAETTLALRIRDDGVGFNPAEIAGPSAGHFGLQGMRERIKRLGGKIEITSAPGQGTVIEVIVPA